MARGAVVVILGDGIGNCGKVRSCLADEPVE